jgi:toxin YhaV
MTVNGWNLFRFVLFADILNKLEQDVTELARKDPDGFIHHKKTKLLKSVHDSITKDVPNDPNDAKFRLGKTLGDRFTDWRRVKRGLPPRYRLFFKFTSAQRKIIYVWLNDEHTLRKEGSKTDVYEVFKQMLKRGQVPDSIADLLKKSAAPQ